jgi:hypothetical protein
MALVDAVVPHTWGVGGQWRAYKGYGAAGLGQCGNDGRQQAQLDDRELRYQDLGQ